MYIYLISFYITGIYPPRDGLRPHPLAGSSFLRLRRGSVAAGVLSGTALPRCGGGDDETPAETSTCEFDRVCGRFWRGRSSGASICGRRNCAGEGGASSSAFYSGAVGLDFVALVGVAKDREGEAGAWVDGLGLWLHGKGGLIIVNNMYCYGGYIGEGWMLAVD